jgi:hypothetical protein
MTDADREFLLAIQESKQSRGRRSPTWSEVLEIRPGLGQEKPTRSA